MLETGVSDRELERQLNLDPRTVKKFKYADAYPEAAPRVRQSIIDDYAIYLDLRLREGCRSSTRLWRELRKLSHSSHSPWDCLMKYLTALLVWAQNFGYLNGSGANFWQRSGLSDSLSSSVSGN